MAENKGILLAKSMQKHAGRAKEKLLQNLGKVDRTGDEIFDEHLTNFNRQHTCAIRLQKEFSNYIRCIRAVQSASKSLMDAIAEVYESQWTGSEALYAQTKSIDTQFQHFSYKLADQVLKQLDTYAMQFPEMKKKIDKRGRKLVDYDSQRHSFQSLQANAAKRKDDIKVTKGREQLEEAKSTYEILNSELHDELPALFDSRILFLVTNLQTLFACEQQFHSETSKVYAELEAIVDKLATESQRGSYTLKKINVISNPTSPTQSPIKTNLSIVNTVINGSANPNGHNLQNAQMPEPAVSPEDEEPSYQNTDAIKAVTATTISSNLNKKSNDNSSSKETTNEIEMKESGSSEDADPSTLAGSQQTFLSNGMAYLHQSHSNQQEGDSPQPIAVINSQMFMDDALEITQSPSTDMSSSKGICKPPNIVDEGIAEITSSPPREVDHPTSPIAPSTAISQTTQHICSSNYLTGDDPHILAGVLAAPDTFFKEHCPFVTSSIFHRHATNATNQNTNVHNNNAMSKNPSSLNVHDHQLHYSSLNNNSKLYYNAPVGATTTDLPPGVLYRVKATYKYVREDVDELSFDVGDIIDVVEYEDPEDQEEGWLMGSKAGTNEKGMFPANFTRPL
ncbi:myc box-dependent-interacting protein 1 isoform X2 [Anopheles aquasalis]|uniref:myc box-dependent-interacting protein 1 isoform X2 n=1 Tax=Anopheles aquasalis TaxID=42839 RepID=UPI00215A6735|nr:myc box-dependent-interacting protein 1 isoform X2 [Anopheles aquasalis]